jgi:hypothetical protein
LANIIGGWLTRGDCDYYRYHRSSGYPLRGSCLREKRIENIISRSGEQPLGVSSLAAGADQLFAATLLKAGGQLHVVVPCRGYEKTFSEQTNLNYFLDLLQKADTVETLDNPDPSEEAFLQAGHRVVDLSELLIAVWDGKTAKGKGGTADVVDYARERGREIVILWPAGVAR